MHVRWRGLELPSQVNVERSTLSATYGKFTAEPFERGFGATIGNSLRRVSKAVRSRRSRSAALSTNSVRFPTSSRMSLRSF